MEGRDVDAEAVFKNKLSFFKNWLNLLRRKKNGTSKK